MQLLFKLPACGGTAAIDVESADTIESLKLKLYHKEGILPSHQRLSLNSRPLDDTRLSAHIGAGDDIAVVEVNLRILGGAQLGKAVKGRSRDRRRVKDTGPSDEERALQEKIRRMQEYDKIHKRALQERKRLQALMKTEMRNTHVNRLKIQNQWRKIMRLAKLEQLRKDIEILSQSHERDVDRKDAILQMLDRDLEEAEEQFQMANRSNVQNIDRLIDLHDSRLLALENEFEKELRILDEEFAVEKAAIVKQHSIEKAEIEGLMALVEAQENELEQEALQEHEQAREMIRNRNLEDINVLRITLDSNIEDLEQHFETAHLNYLQNTDQRTADFKRLTDKDHELSKEIEIKMRKIERLQASLMHWRTKMAANVKEAGERNRALLQEKDAIAKHFFNLKKQMNQYHAGQEARLLDITKTVRKAKAKLLERQALAESILMQAEMARKLETEREKVVPFYTSSVEELDQNSEEQLSMAKGDAMGEGSSIDEWNYLDNFWKRYNKVLLDKLQIEKEHERLTKENGDLQSILKQYIDGISVNEDVMNGMNPLMVVNGRVNMNKPQPLGPDANIPVLEGNHLVETRRVN